MQTITQKNQPIFINGRKAAVLRNYGALCDIRRHSNGFLYNPYRVAMSEALLETLSDSVLLQFTNMETNEVWTVTVQDFRRMAVPIQYGSFEPQRAAEVSRLSYTHSALNRKRVNELQHVEHDPRRPEYKQMGLGV